jgi:hypothetical protein
MSYLISEGAAPSTPASGKVAVYAKTDGRVYGKDDAGTEFTMSGPIYSSFTSLSSTAVDFNIPTGTRRITLSFSGLSTSGTSPTIVQLGDPTIENTGYAGAVADSTASVALSSGFTLIRAQVAAATYSGTIVLTCIDTATNLWVAISTVARADGTAVIWNTAGNKATSTTTSVIRITQTNGTDTFDGGSVTVTYE